MYEQNRSVLPLSRKEGWQLWRRWVLANLCAEIVGLAIAALVSSGTSWLASGISRPADFLLGILSSILSGLVVGLLIGLAQLWVLHRCLPSIAAKSWLIATGSGISVIWLIGMFVGGNLNLADLTIGMDMLALGILLLMALLGGWLGLVQWFILRQTLPQAGLWVVANALAWTLGLAIAFTGAGLLPATLMMPQLLMLASCIGLAACGTIGAVHGFILMYLLRLDSSSKGSAISQGQL